MFRWLSEREYIRLEKRTNLFCATKRHFDDEIMGLFVLPMDFYAMFLKEPFALSFFLKRIKVKHDQFTQFSLRPLDATGESACAQLDAGANPVLAFSFKLEGQDYMVFCLFTVCHRPLTSSTPMFIIARVHGTRRYESPSRYSNCETP